MSRSAIWLVAAVLAVAAVMSLAVACSGDDSASTATPNSQQTTPAVTPTKGPPPPGVTDSEVVLGAYTSLTGPAAAYSVLPKASLAYFAYINAQGGVNGRQIKYILCDDAYNPTNSVQCSKKLVEQDKIFAMFSALGTGTNQAAIPYLDEQGVPSMFISANVCSFVDPLTGNNKLHFLGSPCYTVDGATFAQYIMDKYPSKKVGLLIQNDDYGKDTENGAKAKLGSSVTIVGTQTYEPNAPDVSSQVLSLKSAGAEVVILAALPKQAANAIVVANQQGWKPVFMIPQAGTQGLLELINDASISDGIMKTDYFKVFGDTSDPAIKKWQDDMAKYGEAGLPPGQGTAYGWCRAEMMVEALKLAGKDLTRDGLIAATEKMGAEKWACSLFDKGMAVTFSPTDHTALKQMNISVAKGTAWTPAQ